jgi:two-component system sensor histidine kinase HydH
MSLSTYPARLLWSAVFSSALLAGLCAAVAAYLAREQARTADVLGENIGSRHAVSSLEETLTDLVALHERGVREVAPLRERVEFHLSEIDRYANSPRERELAAAIAASYRSYLAMADDAGRPGQQAALARHLLGDTLPACRRLRSYNADQVEESEQIHRDSLRRMAWGLAVVGSLGSIAGLVFGYGLARGLRRTIHQFLVRVQGASDLLGQEVPAVEWQRVGEPIQDGADDLVRRVEQVVLKLQQSEREVRRAERLAALGQLAAGVAHEIRNPLTSALLLIETGRKDPAAGGLTDEDLDLIEQELHRIEQSLQVFLDYARPPRLERTPCDLAAVARDALALARGRVEQQGVAVRLDLPPGGCPLEADREQLRQVVLNLILNALDALPRGGTLTVAVRPADGRAAELSVADTGAGIPPDILPRLFEPFATGKETGLGLGLVVSKRIVEDHGGTINGVNQPDGGARFVVRLPGSHNSVAPMV